MTFTQEFKRENHVYRNSEFAEMLKDAVRFFHGTPVFPIPPPERFAGAGVYAIYCIAKDGPYAVYGNRINRLSYRIPIYVGKAVPSGWRQSRALNAESNGTELCRRLRQHARSLLEGKGVEITDFACRFAIFEGETAQMIAAVEAALICEHAPLWNSVIDGFGNHDPGGRRASGKLSQWDALHPGRGWTKNMTGEAPDVKDLRRRIKDYLVALR